MSTEKLKIQWAQRFHTILLTLPVLDATDVSIDFPSTATTTDATTSSSGPSGATSGKEEEATATVISISLRQPPPPVVTAVHGSSSSSSSTTPAAAGGAAPDGSASTAAEGPQRVVPVPVPAAPPAAAEGTILAERITLFAPVIPARCTVFNSGRAVYIRLLKATRPAYWNRLFADSAEARRKSQTVTVDWGHWRDEDDLAEEAEEQEFASIGPAKPFTTMSNGININGGGDPNMIAEMLKADM